LYVIDFKCAHNIGEAQAPARQSGSHRDHAIRTYETPERFLAIPAIPGRLAVSFRCEYKVSF